MQKSRAILLRSIFTLFFILGLVPFPSKAQSSSTFLEVVPSRMVKIGDTFVLTATLNVPSNRTTTIFWLKNGIPFLIDSTIVGDVNPVKVSRRVSGAVIGDSGEYRVRYLDSAGKLLESNGIIIVVQTPVIITASPPPNKVIALGESSTIGVSATGTDLKFQWRRNGIPIAGQNSPTLIIGPAKSVDEGKYDCQVFNEVSSSISGSSYISIAFPPQILNQPTSVAAMPNTRASFKIEASGTPPLSFHWFKDGASLVDGHFQGSATSTLVIPSTTAADEGSYRVQVVNAQGQAMSINARLTIGPAVKTQPQLFSVVEEGAAFTLALTAEGTAPLGYQWYHNGVLIAGANDNTLTITAAKISDGGSYIAKVSNAAGITTTRSASVSINPLKTPPSFIAYPVERQVVFGQQVLLSAKLGGTQPMQFRWRRSQVPGGPSVVVSDSILPEYRIANAADIDDGYYTLEVINSIGSVSSPPIKVSVDSGPVIISQTGSLDVAPGDSATFSVVVAGKPPVRLTWLKNGNPLSGETNATLALLNVDESLSGSMFSIRATTESKTIESLPSRLRVSPQFSQIGTEVLNITSPASTLELKMIDASGNLVCAEGGTNYALFSSTGKTIRRGSGRPMAGLADSGIIIADETLKGRLALSVVHDGVTLESISTNLPPSMSLLINNICIRQDGDAVLFCKAANSPIPVPNQNGYYTNCNPMALALVWRRNGKYLESSLTNVWEYLPKPVDYGFYIYQGDAYGALASDDTSYCFVRASAPLYLTPSPQQNNYITTCIATASDLTPFWSWNKVVNYKDHNSFPITGVESIAITEESDVIMTALKYPSKIAPHINPFKLDLFGVESGPIDPGIRADVISDAITGPPVIGLDGRFYYGGTGKITCLGPDGSLVWSLAPPGVNSTDVVSSGAIAADGTVYFLGRFSLLAYDANGNLKWAYKVRKPVSGNPLIGDDSVVYFTAGNELHGVKGSAPVAPTAWPTYAANPRRTFRSTKPPRIARSLSDRSVVSGSELVATAKVSGTPPIMLQWEFRGDPIPGETNLTLQSTVKASSAGKYSLHAFNPATGIGDRLEFNLSVEPAVPAVTWPRLGIKTFGHILSPEDLNPAANSLGHFEFDPPAGVMLPAGTNILKASFVPQDPGNVANLVISNVLEIVPAVPRITWETIPPITYPSPIDSSTFRLTSDTPGNFGFDVLAGDVLAAGSWTIHCVFTPNDINNWTLTSASNILTVLPGEPIVLWNPPDSAIAGMPLSSDFFLASSAVAGAFVYDPLPGAILSEGTQLIQANFNPADPNYHPVSVKRSVEVVVRPSLSANLNLETGLVAISWDTGGKPWTLQVSRDSQSWVSLTNNIISVGTTRVFFCQPKMSLELFKLTR
jgi:hypothetical protein